MYTALLLMFVITLQPFPVTKSLTWDANHPSENVTSCIVSLNGKDVGVASGTSYLLTLMTIGPHTIAVRAKNADGESDPTSITYTVPAGPAPVPQTPGATYMFVTVGATAIGLPESLLISTVTECSFQAETASIRWRNDSATLLSSVGIPLPVGQERRVSGLNELRAVRMIRATTANSRVHVWCR